MNKQLLVGTVLFLLLMPACAAAGAGGEDRPLDGVSLPGAGESAVDPAYRAVPGDVPAWTYELYYNALLPLAIYRRADPVNVVWHIPYRSVAQQLGAAGWRESSRWNILEANVNFLPSGPWMIPQKANFFLDSYGGMRYHLRVWDTGGLVIGQAHIDTSIPHSAYGYESAEARVARAFGRYFVRRNELFLGNACRDGKGYVCNGWATTIKYK